MYFESKIDSCCYGKRNPYFHLYYRGFSLWNRNSKLTSSDCSRNHLLVRSINRRHLPGNRNELHNTKHQCNYKLLCRCNQ